MRIVLQPRWMAMLCLVVCACDCGADRLGVIDRTTIVIESPLPGASAGWDEQVFFLARADNPSGLESLELLVAADRVGHCETDADAFGLSCDATFRPADHQGHIIDGKLRLVARGLDRKDRTAEVFVDLLVRRPPPVVTVVIELPEPETAVEEDAHVTFRATAASVIGLRGMTLKAGGETVANCKGKQVPDETLACEEMFWAWDHLDALREGKLALVAQAADRDGNLGEATLELEIQPVETFISITSPAPETTVSSASNVTFSAIAVNRLGLQALTLKVGQRELLRCDGAVIDDPDATERSCEKTFAAQAFGDQVEAGLMELVAVATDARGRIVTRSLFVQVEPITITFKEPVLTQQNPPVASVRGTGRVEVEVASVTDIHRVWLFLDNEQLGMFASPPFRVELNWQDRLGETARTLRAVADDVDGVRATAERVVQLAACESDSQCPNGQRCCIDTGTCHPIVGAGELCDCTRPCPEDQGCFPGTCGEPPRRCRPGCYTGTSSCTPDTCTPADRADRCEPEDGKPAYCSLLPASEQTEENRGGACAPADSCDVVRQDCPNLPLDRTQPVSSSNPARPHKCIPVSPNTNACTPAGPRQVNDTCSGGRCGDSAALSGCVKGATCVTLFRNNVPYDVRCLKLCTADNHCPRVFVFPVGWHQQTCQTLYGAGWEPYTVGVCQ